MVGKRQVVTLSSLALAALVALLPIVARQAKAQTEAVLYNFTGGAYDVGPAGRLTSDGRGNWYGTTSSEGQGWGTVFKLSPNHEGGWGETVLYTFTGGADGGNPGFSDVIFDSRGNLYGTTSGGGTYGYGTVFELHHARKRRKSWTETVLYSFNGTENAFPGNGVIMDPAGNLYGTTYFGGSAGSGGTVFELSPSGGTWTERVIYSPGDSGLHGINDGLTMDAAGNIFGVSYLAVFELSRNGSSGWNSTVLHSFSRSPKSAVNFLAGSPVLDKAGNLYITMTAWPEDVFQFSHASRGTVFKLAPQQNGIWKTQTLFTFSPTESALEGNGPYGGLVLDTTGNIYGTTIAGGQYSQGTVFELVAPAVGGNYTEKVLWSFNGNNRTDGSLPSGGVILDSAGHLYGTTAFGGTGGGGSGGGYGGVVFQLTP